MPNNQVVNKDANYSVRTLEKDSVNDTQVIAIDIGGAGAEVLLSVNNPMPVHDEAALFALSLIATAVQGTLAVSVTGGSTAALQTAGNNLLGSIDTKLTSQVTSALQTAANLSLDNLDHAHGAQGDAAAGTDTGAFSFMSLFKRHLTQLATLIAKIPALGSAAPSASQPVTLSNDVAVSTGGFVTALNTELLTNTVSGWYDAQNFHSAAIQIIANTTITAGAIIFEQTNDITLSPNGTVLLAEEPTTAAPTVAAASFNIASGTVRMFNVQIVSRYIRVRIATAFTGATTGVQASAVFSQLPYNRMSQLVYQPTAANLNAATIAGNSTSLMGDVGIQYRGTVTGGASRAHLVSAATTNASVIKASAGRLYGYRLANTTASWRYVKLHNSATAPTAGAGVVGTIGIPPNAAVSIVLDGGESFTTGIAITTTTGPLDTDAVAVAAGDIVGDFLFA